MLLKCLKRVKIMSDILYLLYHTCTYTLTQTHNLQKRAKSALIKDTDLCQERRLSGEACKFIIYKCD